MTDNATCGWALELITKAGKTTELLCTEDSGHADTLHSDGETSWTQRAQQAPPAPDTELELP